jgi:hypothetical protein
MGLTFLVKELSPYEGRWAKGDIINAIESYAEVLYKNVQLTNSQLCREGGNVPNNKAPQKQERKTVTYQEQERREKQLSDRVNELLDLISPENIKRYPEDSSGQSLMFENEELEKEKQRLIETKLAVVSLQINQIESSLAVIKSVLDLE